jgi:hypothetical protein
MTPLRIMLLIIALFGVLQLRAESPVSCSAGWHLCRFDAPSRMTNTGSQIVVSYSLDPSTQSWMETLRFPKSPGYLDFGHPGDEVHHGETLSIKKPVTIAFTNFKGGPVEVAFTKAPASHDVREHPPLDKKP